jgi:diphthine-ammonia ligase
MHAQIVALGNLLPADDAVDELDSWMFQTVGHQLVAGYAAACALPLLRRRIRGASRHTVSVLSGYGWENW